MLERVYIESYFDDLCGLLRGDFRGGVFRGEVRLDLGVLLSVSDSFLLTPCVKYSVPLCL